MLWKFECQILKYSMRRLLQHWTESSIILTSKEGSVWRNRKPKRRTVFLRGRQIAYLIYEYFRVTGANDSVENYADPFTVGLRNDDIEEFDSKLDGILLSMTKIPPDDILEGLYKLRIRESEKLKTVLELFDLEIHQKKIGPDYHRLKTMVKRSIEQDIRNRNFGARTGNFEKNAVVKNQETKQRCTKKSWRLLAMVKPTGSVLKETIPVSVTISISVQNWHSRIRLLILSCSRMSEMRREPEVRRGKSPSGRMSRWLCKDYLKGTCNNSFCEKWHPPECLIYKTTSGCRLGEKCSFAHGQVDEQPSKWSQKNGHISAVAMLKKYESYDRTEKPDVDRDTSHERHGPVVYDSSNTRQLGCVSQDWSRRSLHRFYGRTQTYGNRSNV